MKKLILILLAAAVLGAVLGVGYAYSNDPAAPLSAGPDLAADETLVAGPDGEALRCNGKPVKVKRGAGPPSLTPEQVVELKKNGKINNEGVKVARCEKKAGKETGKVKWVDQSAP